MSTGRHSTQESRSPVGCSPRPAGVRCRVAWLGALLGFASWSAFARTTSAQPGPEGSSATPAPVGSNAAAEQNPEPTVASDPSVAVFPSQESPEKKPRSSGVEPPKVDLAAPSPATPPPSDDGDEGSSPSASSYSTFAAASLSHWSETIVSSAPVHHALIGDLPLEVAGGSMLSLGFGLGIRLMLFDDWELHPRFQMAWRRVPTRMVDEGGNEHTDEDADQDLLLPESEMLFAIPIFSSGRVAEGTTWDGWGTSYQAPVPTRRRLQLLVGGRVAFAQEGRLDVAIPLGLRYGGQSTGQVKTTSDEVDFLKGWWLQARVIGVPKGYKFGFDAEARYHDIALYVEHLPASDTRAWSDERCDTPPCQLPNYPYSSLHGLPSSSQTLAGLRLVYAPGWGL